MTELQKLKQKKKAGKATPADLTRLKQLQDGEPLSASDLEEAEKREANRKAADKKAYEDKHNTVSGAGAVADVALDTPAEHPRIAEIKQALMPFTQIEAHDSRPDEFVLITRGISITAGDVRKARQAMKI